MLTAFEATFRLHPKYAISLACPGDTYDLSDLVTAPSTGSDVGTGVAALRSVSMLDHERFPMAQLLEHTTLDEVRRTRFVSFDRTIGVLLVVCGFVGSTYTRRLLEGLGKQTSFASAPRVDAKRKTERSHAGHQGGELYLKGNVSVTTQNCAAVALPD